MDVWLCVCLFTSPCAGGGEREREKERERGISHGKRLNTEMICKIAWIILLL